ncbi:MAG: YggT family protein [Candidatus Riflebacteria bacterium]|nr:YggT family protein [Candidatus Riflebacteria bacterium]
MGLLVLVVKVMQLAILFRILLSWFVRDTYDRRLLTFTRTVDKFLKPFRVTIPMGAAGVFLDLGPILALVTLQMLESILISF